MAWHGFNTDCDPPDDSPDQWCKVCGDEMTDEGCPNEPHTPEIMARVKAEYDNEIAALKAEDDAIDKALAAIMD